MNVKGARSLFLGAPQIEEPAHGIRLGGRTHLHRGNSLVERSKLVERVLGKIDVPGPGGTSSACVDDADEYAPVGAVADYGGSVKEGKGNDRRAYVQ